MRVKIMEVNSSVHFNYGSLHSYTLCCKGSKINHVLIKTTLYNRI